MVGSRKVIAAAGTAAAAAAIVAGKKLLSHRARSDATDATVYHVAPDGEEWSVQAEGSKQASSKHPSKRAAVSAARSLARGQTPSRLVIHRSDGTIQRQHAYGV